jgi:hypothetical protein
MRKRVWWIGLGLVVLLGGGDGRGGPEVFGGLPSRAGCGDFYRDFL